MRRSICRRFDSRRGAQRAEALPRRFSAGEMSAEAKGAGKDMDRILLFIPMYNCQKQIVRVLAQLRGEAAGYLSQVIVVNNRSTDDGERAVIDWLRDNPLRVPVKLLRNDENYGLGGSHKVAFAYALAHGFDYVIVLHGDDQGDVANLLPYLKSREYAGYDAFLGARFMKGSRLQGYSTFRTVGNRVYDLLFSVGAGRMVYDLGSGLNLYAVKSLEGGWYLKFKDNLMFNCYMLLAASSLGQRVRFFPIVWREDDQVSNVKMLNQAMRTLGMLRDYVRDKKGFLEKEHRDRIVGAYTAQEIFSAGPAED